MAAGRAGEVVGEIVLVGPLAGVQMSNATPC